MDGYGRRRLGGAGRCEEKTIVGLPAAGPAAAEVFRSPGLASIVL